MDDAIAEDLQRHPTTFVERLVDCCANALGNQVVAVILHGSLTLGDFQPGRSDIDLLIVVEQPLADETIRSLQRAVDSLSVDAPCRVDLRVVTREAAASPMQAPPMEASIALCPGQPAVVETRVAAEPDLVVEFSMVRGHGRSIVGVDPGAIIGTIPDAWVSEVGIQQLAAWQHLADDAAYAELMVLTTCRIWRYATEGVHCTKSEAGHWALVRDPSLTAVAEALRHRGGNPEATMGVDGIRRLITLVRRELANH